jgi:hypothetical protein
MAVGVNIFLGVLALKPFFNGRTKNFLLLPSLGLAAFNKKK